MLRLLAAAALAAPMSAHEFRVGAIMVDHPVLRTASPLSKTGAGYMVIRNTGRTADTLLAVTTRAATRADLHGSSQSGGVMRMRAQAAGIAIPAGGRVAFAPGALHVMFIGLKTPLPSGTPVAAKLVFARAGSVDVVFTAKGFTPAGD